MEGRENTLVIIKQIIYQSPYTKKYVENSEEFIYLLSFWIMEKEFYLSYQKISVILIGWIHL